MYNSTNNRLFGSVQMTQAQELPKTWLIAFLFLGLVVMRMFGIDSFTTAGISLLIGYITGQHIEAQKNADATKQPRT